LHAIYRKPWVGLLGLFVGFMTQPLGHTVYTLIETGAGHYYPIAAVTTGIVGLVIVWRGLKRDEHSATLHGLLGGWLLWIGWFEFSFKYFAELYAVPPFAVEPEIVNGYAAAPQASMLQATLPLMVALVLVYGIFNFQTKCNFMRWFHRNLRFSPGMPTPDNHRSFARITAMEVLFVTWFCYLFWLYMIYFGTRGSGINITMSVYGVWTVWSVYLLYKSTQQVRVAPAIRYGVGAGIVLWAVAEMPAHFGAYKELWLKPFEYPVFNLVSATLFVAGWLTLARRRKPTNVGAAAETA
jgi:hypothetical protein